MIDLFQLLVEFGVLIGLIVYARDTHGLRRDSSDQLVLLKKQFKLAQRPFVMPSVLPVVWDTDKNVVVHKLSKTPVMNPKRVELPEDPETIRLAVSFRNIGQTLATTVRAYLYDNSTKKYHWTQRAAGWLEPTETGALLIDPTMRTRLEAREHIGERIGTLGKPISSELGGTHSTSFLLLVFENDDGSIYCVKRTFSQENDGEIFHRHTTRSHVDQD